MSASDWIALFALLLTALGMFAGGVWWMSALFSKVGQIQVNTKETSTKLDTLTERMDGDMHEVRTIQREQQLEIGDLKVRMVVVEGQIETEEQ